MKKSLLFILIFAIVTIVQSKAQYANRKLSNLQATSVNRSLIAKISDSLDLGSSIKAWQNLYVTKGIYFWGIKSVTVDTAGNTALGSNNLNLNTGYNNTAIEFQANYLNLNGSNNTAIGKYALFSNTIGNNNTAIGNNSLLRNTEGNYNTASGDGSAFGKQALVDNTSGFQNVAVGESALHSNTSGYNNVALGYECQYYNTTGRENVAIGGDALISNINGVSNTAIGYSAGSANDYNIYDTYLGYDADQSSSNYTNGTAIGAGSRITASQQVRIGSTSVNSIGGYVGWSNISDGRYKRNVAENVPGLKFINKLRPVTYNLDVRGISNFLGEDITNEENKKGYIAPSKELKALIEKFRTEKEKFVYTGFIAQEVEKTAKELGYNFSGVDAPKNANDLYSLRYAEFVVPLVKAVQELSKQNDELRERLNKIESLLSNQSITNTETEKTSATILTYPNPAKNLFYIQSKINASFSLTDATGKVVINKHIDRNGSIDVSKITSGTYFLKNDLNSETQKVIIEK